MRQQYQGDISIIRVDAEPKIEWGKFKNNFVVAEGEVTGHKHVLVAEPKQDILFGQDERGYWLKIGEGSEAKLTHEEHAAHTLEQGIYFIGRQYEYDELKDYKKVLD